MDLSHRNLIEESTLCESLCAKNLPINCPKSCSVLCPETCVSSYDPYCVSPPTSLISSSPNHHQFSTFLTVTIVLLAASFLVICGYVFYTKYYNNSRRRNSSRQSDRQNRDDHEFLDEEHGPAVDHPIWYIRTAGLQPSIINSIAVLKYKKGEGLVEGTDCSVCLSEFQEDESLRLLPKCSHAFHIPCIDTWLRSHTNCPMCRAPIVINSVIRTSLPEPSSVDSGSEEETVPGNSENDGENDAEMGRDEEGKRGESSGDIEVVLDRMSQPSRRSFSLDCSSGSKISSAMSKECDGSIDKKMEIDNKLRSANGGKKVGGNQKLKRMRSGSSNERSLQSRPVSMKRSVSWSGKFVLCRQIKSSDSILPLRSI